MSAMGGLNADQRPYGGCGAVALKPDVTPTEAF
jgi:hypothetical protein